MTRFLYIADTHWGAGDTGYHMQPRYPGRLPQILAVLQEWAARAGDIDFVLHGGDLVERGEDSLLAEASGIFSLDLPVRLCVGNHDLTAAQSATRWPQLAPAFFPGAELDYTLHFEDCVLHVAPNQWGSTPYRWEDVQEPSLLDAQIARLEEELSHRKDVVHVLCTHSPVLGVPAEQTGHGEPFHVPPSAFTAQVGELARRHPQLRCILGAHSHVNMNALLDGVPCVTVSSLTETPFEFKLLEVAHGGFGMRTVSLLPRLSFGCDYDFDRTFVQGRERDRTLAVTRPGG